MINKTNVKNFFKTYGYWVAFALSIALLITIVTIAIVNKPAPIEEDFTPVVNEEIKFADPLADMALMKDYSNTKLQYSNTLKLWQAHKAVDLAAEEGTDVIAVLDGTVTEVTYNYLMGNIVKLDVGGGITVVYASLASDIPVKQGDAVTKGSVIGKVGKTAKSEASDGAHLHLEVLLNGESVDPNLYLDLSAK
ncbi:MAG: M23 family metallopeptidase [Clostridia bacterium]|nr:M23 family metallopeptidase [Clostridia bacterium]